MALTDEKVGRYALVKVRYEDKDMSASITPLLQSVTFSDTISGGGDSYTFTIVDRSKRFIKSWHPRTGAELYAYAHLRGFDGTNKVKTRKFGYTQISTLNIKGPSTVVTLTGVSIPFGRGAKTKRTKAYTKTSLKKIAQLIAKRLKLKLLYKASQSPSYDRVQQSKENDLVFLNRLANEAGFVLKVSTKALTILDERDLEGQPAKETFKESDPKISYDFNETLTNGYSECVVSYTDSKKKKTHKVVFRPKKAIKGDVLHVNEEFKTKAAGIRIAKDRLREANKDLVSGTLSYIGLLNRYAGDCIKLDGFGAFDGKYLITSVDGSIGSGTTTSLQIRKVLDGY